MTSSPAEPEPLTAYLEALEAHLTRLRGREHVLSPPDFGLARTWHQAGVPLALVLSALDAAAAADRALSLAGVRREVESAFRSRA